MNTVVKNCEDDEIENLEKQLSAVFATVNHQALMIPKHHMELIQYRKSVEELDKENDELVTTMLEITSENDELKLLVENAEEQNILLYAQVVHLLEDLDVQREQSLDPTEMAEVIGELRYHMKYKLKEVTAERLEAELYLENLMSQRDELYQTKETMVSGRIDMEKEMKGIREQLHYLRLQSGYIGLEEYGSGEKLVTGLRGKSNNFIRQDECLEKDARMNYSEKTKTRNSIDMTFGITSPRHDRFENIKTSTQMLFL
mmetsp:Transcript_45668/g.67393  ORF Transcript_45668/g.67393 Transcript_45668/m.67393 type:complete len:258 (-) Transcript_45668:416-1189(-)|eukprot:CAMPEP_0195528672 /NCGR_PEP_ID=MMETSP0794_2-20130614/30921_1 /TAXON_ID=515487 /ORGANISM="Stephanopyxis turris, Strain CCMP 815" /LENGTH=257 /DNA_ID=CAMNT_0040659843 /DNA_START=136 /DNA_END=909 /DNA_ORIENTATION=+